MAVATAPRLSSRASARRPPLPAIAPMLAVLSELPRDQEAYGFEYKWDGVRAMTYWDGRTLRILGRAGNDITPRYPELALLGKALGRTPAILDGEIVALDEEGRPSFPLLQERMHVRDPGPALVRRVPVWLLFFDLLHRGRRSLLQTPYVDRRALLERVTVAGASWRVPPSYIGEGTSVLDAARKTRLEGVVAKRLDSPYRPGARSPDWLKIKIVEAQELVIGGWVPEKSGRAGRIGALLAGYFDGGKLRYAGKIGTGLDAADHLHLGPLLTKLARADSPFAERVPVPAARFVQPKLVMEIEYRRWPAGGLVQQAAFKGLRNDKEPQEVVREQTRHGGLSTPDSGE
jgi:bifunctional non-homologous end joining protein LigD